MRKQPPKQLKTLENLLQQAEHYSEYMMTGSSGSVPPTLMALTPEGFIMHIPQRFNSPDAKDLFAKTIRLMAVGYKASAVAMISESWIVTKKSRNRELDLSVPPSESPDREEVVSIMAESREVRAQRFLFIQRESFGKVTHCVEGTQPCFAQKRTGVFHDCHALRWPQHGGCALDECTAPATALEKRSLQHLLAIRRRGVRVS